MLHRITTQIGQTSTDHGAICKQVREYLAAVNINPSDDATCPDWDGALLAWAAIKDGIVPPVNAADPMSWLTWGTPLDTPIPGAVAVMTSGSGRHRMACGMVARVQMPKVYVLTASDGTVQSKVVPIEQVIAARRPPGASMPVQPDAAPLTAFPQITINNTMPPYQGPLQLPAPAHAEQYPMALPAPIPSEPQILLPQSAAPPVTMEALANLLAHVQSEFASVHQRIDQVAEKAIGAVQIEHIKD